MTGEMGKKRNTVTLSRQAAEEVATALYAVLGKKYEHMQGAPPNDPLRDVAEALRSGWDVVVSEE